MKIKILPRIIYAPILAVAFTFAACDDYLDKLPEEDMTIEQAFSEYTHAKRFLANAYMHLPKEINWMVDQGNTSDRNPWVGASDEMEVAYSGAATHLINAGSLSPQTSHAICPVWDECFMGIRKANIILENVDKIPLVLAGAESLSDVFTEQERNEWKGEAYMLRAMAYLQLIRTYGPVPIFDHSLSTDANYNDVRRQPVQECIQFVADDCDRAAALLPIRYLKGSEESLKLGRFTKGAALALKSRILLYAASPLYNGDPDYAGFTDNEGVRLFPQSADPGKWTIAANAAMECINACEAAGHKLYAGTGDNFIDNYRRIFLDLYNDEWIYWRTLKLWTHFDRCSTPLSLSGFSILCPTQEFVDAFQMANGVQPITGYEADGATPVINPSSGYVETGYVSTESPDGYWLAGVRNMFVNREPRFYAIVNFPGKQWRNTTCEFWNTGVDGYARHNASDYCKTGYLNAKYVEPGVQFPSYSGEREKCWIFFRMAEIYLNYAEAINEAEGPAKAYEYVNRIRKRAGLPDLPTGLTKEQMREAVRQERRIELAFETHRYFDVRRWKIAEQTDNKPVHSLNITAGTHLQDDEFYQRIVCDPRSFEKKNYFFPIPFDEISTSEYNIVQNPGYASE
ncbi:MAG: RagB/SusD family nutrient uptake outer membrane protein [Tannerella sp.]|nr:RagB/SusD family nutrient uptake outer membrane protein [Tannerella sp.]